MSTQTDRARGSLTMPQPGKFNSDGLSVTPTDGGLLFRINGRWAVVKGASKLVELRAVVDAAIKANEKVDF